MVNDVDGAKREMTMMLFVFQLLSECHPERGEGEEAKRGADPEWTQEPKDPKGFLWFALSTLLSLSFHFCPQFNELRQFPDDEQQNYTKNYAMETRQDPPPASPAPLSVDNSCHSLTMTRI